MLQLTDIKGFIKKCISTNMFKVGKKTTTDLKFETRKN